MLCSEGMRQTLEPGACRIPLDGFAEPKRENARTHSTLLSCREADEVIQDLEEKLRKALEGNQAPVLTERLDMVSWATCWTECQK